MSATQPVVTWRTALRSDSVYDVCMMLISDLVEFTDEEGYGKYLDLHECYVKFINLKGIEVHIIADVHYHTADKQLLNYIHCCAVCLSLLATILAVMMTVFIVLLLICDDRSMYNVYMNI